MWLPGSPARAAMVAASQIDYMVGRTVETRTGKLPD